MEIDRLRKELYSTQHGKPDQTKAFEIKKLLEIIDKMTEENTTLKAILSSPRIRPPSRSSLPTPSTPTRTVIHTHIHTNSPSIHRTSCETAVT